MYGAQGQHIIPDSNVFLPTLVGSSPYSINVIPNVCGDGHRTGSEVWDDANTSNGDGWSSSWALESGYSWTGGSTTKADVCLEVCVGSKRFTSRTNYWDDGNTQNGDGCSSTWSVEIGWSWSEGTMSTKDVWSKKWWNENELTTIIKTFNLK